MEVGGWKYGSSSVKEGWDGPFWPPYLDLPASTTPLNLLRAGEASRNPVRPGVVLATIPVSPVTAPHGSSDNVRPRVTVSALPTSSSVVRCICLHVL